MEKYIAPLTKVINMETENIIASSPLTGGGLGNGTPAEDSFIRDWFLFDEEGK